MKGVGWSKGVWYFCLKLAFIVLTTSTLFARTRSALVYVFISVPFRNILLNLINNDLIKYLFWRIVLELNLFCLACHRIVTKKLQRSTFGRRIPKLLWETRKNPKRGLNETCLTDPVIYPTETSTKMDHFELSDDLGNDTW